MLSSIGRAAIRRVTTGHQSTNGAALSIRRVEGFQTRRIASNHLQSHLSTYRTYATATASKTTPKTSGTSKAATETKPATKKSVVGKTVKKSVKKPVKKSVKKLATKPKKKVVSKAKPKRKGLTEKQKEALALQKSKQKEKAAVRKTKERTKAASVKSKVALAELKRAALEFPKTKPDNGWKLFISQTMSSGGEKGEGFKEAANKFKTLSPEEKENLSHIAAQNAALNKVAFAQWVESHTPDQILKANQARATLRRKSLRYPKIHDTRIPTKAGSAWIRFYIEKRQAPEFDGMTTVEAVKAISPLWKSMSESERKPYVDAFEVHQRRYEQEYKTIFHRDSPSAIAHKKAS